MARKSRKEMEQRCIKSYYAMVFRVAIYIRLSVEDKKSAEIPLNRREAL